MVNVAVAYNSSCGGGAGFFVNVTNNPTIAGNSYDSASNSESFQFEYDLICSDVINTIPGGGGPAIIENLLRIFSNGNLELWCEYGYNNGGVPATGAAMLASLTGYDFINNQYIVTLATSVVGQGTYIQLMISQGSTQLYNNTFLIAPTSSQMSPTACMLVVAGTAGGTTNFTSGSFTVSLLSDN